MLDIRASPKEESGISAGEAALGHVLAVPGQLLTTTAPPAVILAAKRTYAEAVLDAFVTTWVACYGVLANLTSDRGVQFTSATWTE